MTAIEPPERGSAVMGWERAQKPRRQTYCITLQLFNVQPGTVSHINVAFSKKYFTATAQIYFYLETKDMNTFRFIFCRTKFCFRYLGKVRTLTDK
jgi:hypothetical protein